MTAKKKKATAAEAVTANLQLLPMELIAESKNNPRTQFDQRAIDELADSIKAVGVIQPIVVRPDADGFEVVCGARRFRASKQAGNTAIPAVVRNLTDEEAFELAITENLQRKDVNPLDEAIALLKMKERGYNTKEQAARLGKSESYVIQRLKLNDLIDPLKAAMFEGLLLVGQANLLARISQHDQEQLYASWLQQSMMREGFDPRRHLSSLEENISKAQRKLASAPFDTEDVNVYPSAGPCSTCPKNTACSTLLFPELNPADARCTDSSCWNAKASATMDAALHLVKDFPHQYFLVSRYGRSNTTPKKHILDAVQANGLSITNFLDSSMFTAFERPEMPEEPNRDEYVFEPDEDGWQQHKSQAEADQSYVDDMEQYKTDIEEYHQELAEYEKRTSSGDVQYGFVIEGSGEGTLIPIALKAAVSGDMPAEKTASPQDTITSEIAGIQAREKRAIELDGEKIHAQLVELFKSHESLNAQRHVNDNTTQIPDAIIIPFCQYLYEEASYNRKAGINEYLGINSRYADNEAAWEIIQQFTWKQAHVFISWMLHLILFDKWNNHLPQHSQGKALRYLLEMHLGHEAIKEVESAFKEKADKRAARAAERIADLKSKAKKTN